MWEAFCEKNTVRNNVELIEEPQFGNSADFSWRAYSFVNSWLRIWKIERKNWRKYVPYDKKAGFPNEHSTWNGRCVYLWLLVRTCQTFPLTVNPSRNSIGSTEDAWRHGSGQISRKTLWPSTRHVSSVGKVRPRGKYERKRGRRIAFPRCFTKISCQHGGCRWSPAKLYFVASSQFRWFYFFMRLVEINHWI